MVNRKKYPHGSIFLGKDKITYGEKGTGTIAYDPDFECGGPEGTPGRQCPPAPRKADESSGEPLLHIGLASHRDPLCPKTLFYAYTKAVHPHLLRVRVIQQNDPLLDPDCLETFCQLMAEEKAKKKAANGGATDNGGEEDSEDCPYRDFIKVHRIHAKDAKGPTFARGILSDDIGKDFKKGEVATQDFCLSMDSHMNFEQGWDSSMKDMWTKAENEYAVLSTYVDDAEHLGEDSETVPHLCMVMFTTSVRTHATKACTGLTKPKLTNAIYGAGLSFSKCHAELKVPVDPHTPWVFDGEEFNRAARYWTYGYDIYTPHRVYILHNYHESQSNPKTTSWRRTMDQKAFTEANKRLNTLIDVPGGYTDPTKVEQIKRSKYGLGDRRSLDQLIQFSGIDLRHGKSSIDGVNRCGNLRWVPFVEHPRGADYVPQWDEMEQPLDVADPTSVWYDPERDAGKRKKEAAANRDDEIDVEERFPDRRKGDADLKDGDMAGEEKEAGADGDDDFEIKEAADDDEEDADLKDGDMAGEEKEAGADGDDDFEIKEAADDDEEATEKAAAGDDSKKTDPDPSDDHNLLKDNSAKEALNLIDDYQKTADAKDTNTGNKNNDIAIGDNLKKNGKIFSSSISHLLPPPANFTPAELQQQQYTLSLRRGLQQTLSHQVPHGLRHLPMLLQITVALLVLGMVGAILVSMGTGGEGRKKRAAKTN